MDVLSVLALGRVKEEGEEPATDGEKKKKTEHNTRHQQSCLAVLLVKGVLQDTMQSGPVSLFGNHSVSRQNVA